MSNFYCEHCGALCADTNYGYILGCEHYPPDPATIARCRMEVAVLRENVDLALKELLEASKIDTKTLHEPLDASKRNAERG